MYVKVKGQGHCQGQMSPTFHFCHYFSHFAGCEFQYCGYETFMSHVLISFYLKDPFPLEK